ncbi:uncharacterized protein BX663DRAFT_512377 [Cokeromyces recurvatus]|uniref:uncharacterized protein n=1 Tax=Cokeromyces recurvatus TaxID=90255 RepID=UPI002220D3DB|nr:uncharacterized protein BX663DRAFT_512377 [Cokeromyces recurvatus]KAI7901775.1 hypothetical protein BX663DRAFT_512377 [Cokeromyces recurvatus]
MSNNIELTIDEHIKKVIEVHWKFVINMAQANIDDIEQFNVHDPNATMTSRADQRASSASENTNQQSRAARSIARRDSAYRRESHIVRGLDVLFSMVYKSSGYLSYLSCMLTDLDHDNPIAMAFLNHLLERAALPSQRAISYISPLIMLKLAKKPSRIQRMISLISGKYKLERSLSKRLALRKQIFSIALKPSLSFMVSVQNEEQTKLRLNAAILWCYLANKFAGEMAKLIWNQDVNDLLFSIISDIQEDLMVRIFSLLAIEKFALTRSIKNFITNHNLQIRDILIAIIKECELANERIYFISINNMNQSQKNRFKLITDTLYVETASFNQVNKFSTQNIFDTAFIPPKGPLRDEWGKYAQLNFCSRWALDHRFPNKKKQISFPWDLSNLRIIMNPFDATSKLKIGSNGLELRNDRPYFESVRATACVRKGKWYYEVLLLNSGIVQIGWATSKCKFAPDEGAGVGDDNNSFAFDTFRSCVWSNGSSVYPQGKVRIRCRIGDVVGSYLDLDNGLCRYFVNGRDLKLTVEFENTYRKIDRRKSVCLPERPTLDDFLSSKLISSTHSTPIRCKTLLNIRRELLKRKSVTKGLGLYPAITLTAHQHVLVNFGESPWMFPPPVACQFQAIYKSGYLDADFKRLVMHWVKKCGVITQNKVSSSFDKQPYRPLYGAGPVPDSPLPIIYSSGSSDESSDDDSKGIGESSNCNICFTEPKDTLLLPCKHDGICNQCAQMLITCHLCRAKIITRITQNNS